MPWFKVDDNLAFHQKVLVAGNAAMGLWVRAGSWCAQQLSDGFVPRDIARTMGTAAEAKRLVAARLWLEVADGYTFWQWNEEGRQPTRTEVEAKRKEARERQQRARERRAKSRSDNPRESHGESQRDTPRDISVSHASPDPTRPEVTEVTSLAPATRPSRERPADELFDALVAACRVSTADLTAAGRGTINGALKQLRDVSATPAQITLRARRYSERFPNATLTAPALVKHWATLAQPATANRPRQHDPAWEAGMTP